MRGLAIALNIGGLVAALAITIAAGMLLAVVFHKKPIRSIVSILAAAGAVFALPVWSTSLAWTWSGGGVAVWIVPIVYLVLVIPLAGILFAGASAGAQP